MLLRCRRPSELYSKKEAYTPLSVYSDSTATYSAPFLPPPPQPGECACLSGSLPSVRSAISTPNLRGFNLGLTFRLFALESNSRSTRLSARSRRAEPCHWSTGRLGTIPIASCVGDLYKRLPRDVDRFCRSSATLPTSTATAADPATWVGAGQRRGVRRLRCVPAGTIWRVRDSSTLLRSSLRGIPDGWPRFARGQVVR